MKKDKREITFVTIVLVAVFLLMISYCGGCSIF